MNPEVPERASRPIAYEAYQQMADQYAALIDTKPHNAYYDRPATAALWPDSLNGLNVLDAGCGPGVYSELLVQRGATVIACDASDRMLELAQQRSEKAKYQVELRHVDLAQPLTMFGDAEFDLINAPLCLDYIENWNAIFQEFFRILRPGGSVVFSCEHPTHAAAYHDTNQYFAVERILTTWNGFGTPIEMPSFRRSLQQVVMPVIESGFMIEKLIEPLPTDDFRTADLRRYLELMHRPAFLHVRARKPE